ncbi:hypothetical protein Pmani_027544 [Petrolisthes manimaculis]|uniref:tRNA (32-2'-O)-methyltransferase regulator THADA n=1 Tax=Petrolisthes manimaculis TaxID=1843537 RepID=A0AAE1TYZ5_9EUCA|nr:hypothetical protein Pmani_027544 [Petrolisthes manimaculis]
MEYVTGKQTLKGGKIRKSHMEKFTIDSPPDTAEDEIHQAYKELVHPQSPLEQIGAIEKVADSALHCEECASVCICLLLSSLLQLKPKVPLRNKILKCLPTIKSTHGRVYRDAVMRILRNTLSHTDDSTSLLQGVVMLSENMDHLLIIDLPAKDLVVGESCAANSVIMELHFLMSRAMLQGLNLLWEKCLKESSAVETSSTLQQIQQLVKSSTWYLQHHYSKSAVHSDVTMEAERLLETVLGVICHPTCPLDLRVNCGQLVAVLHRILTFGEMDSLVQQVVDRVGQFTYLPNVAQLSIMNGILCITPGKSLYITQRDVVLGVEILQAAVSPSYMSSDGIVALSAIRLIQQWTLRTLEALQSANETTVALKSALDFNSPLMTNFREYLWLAWDHFLDSVKHSTRETFMNLIKIHNIIDEQQSKYNFLFICKTFLRQLNSQKFKCSAVSCMVSVVGSKCLLELYPTLPHDLLHFMKDPAMASHSAELLEALFTQHQREVSLTEWQSVWLSSFIDLFSKEMQAFGYELLFKKLLFTCPDSLDTAVARLTQYSENSNSEKLCLLIMCVKIGRYSSQWHKKYKAKHQEDCAMVWKGLLPYKIIVFCLSHNDESVQTAVFSLLCESPKSTELPEKLELDLIHDYYVYSVTSQSPPVRQHLVKSTKKLFQRIRDGLITLIKLSKNNERVVNTQAVFCKKLFALMVQNLTCSANFPRRCTSLSVLELFQEIIIEGCGEILGISEIIYDEIYGDTLLTILGDSFENNKLLALKLLQSQHRLLGEEHRGKLSSLVSSVFDLASSCKPPESMTAAYILKYLSSQTLAVHHICTVMDATEILDNHCFREVICKYILHKLKEEVKIAKGELLKAAASGPMYGLLLCLKMLLANIPEQELEKYINLWIELVQEVLTVCFTISEIVAPVVRNSSPEGHLPMDLNPESLESLRAALQESLGVQQFQGDVSLTQNSGLDELVKAQAVSAQMLLLCAWRCVKEVSLILGNLLQDMPLFPSPYAMLSVTNVRNIGQYFLTQLFETKHRGAFEQSYVGFGRVCERLWKCEDEQLRKLPEEWLTQVMTLIQDDCDTRLCATRRSAGVPFIVQAVLSSEPNIHQAACLSKTMTVLLTLAREPQYDGSEARIHAFNILRSVYRDTRLGDLIIPFVSKGVKAAIRGYKSKLWAERNAATLLFAALVTRMLGVKQTQDDLSRKNAVSALVFFRRYPDLFDFLKDELQTGARGIIEGRLVPALFPVLLLLARLAPAPVEGRTSSVSLAMFTPAILQCASSSVLQLRALTSHALVPLVPPSEFQSVVSQLCSKASLTNQNDLHGCLLCLLKLFKNYPENASLDLKKIVECILSISWAATNSNCCLVTRSCALELFTVLCVQHLLPKTSPELKIMSKDSLSLVLENDSAVNVQPWSTCCKKHAVEFLLECMPVENLKTQSLSYYLITSSCYEVRECVLENTHKLPDPPIEMFMLLMARMMSGEENVKCLTLVYQNLYKLIVRPEVCSEVTEETFSSIVKLTLSEVRQDTCIELRDAVIQLGSLALHSLLSRNQTELFKEQLSAWVLVLMKWCGSEHGDGTRLVVAEGVAGILPFLHSHPSVSGETCQQLLETVVYELQDDWSQVRERAAKGATALLICFNNTMHPSLHPARILPKFCDFIGSTGTSESLTLLVTLALKEDLSQGFGLSQNDDRLFDKGEMNIFSENLFVARTAAQSLGSVLSEWSPSEEPPMFLRQSILPYLCSLAAHQSEGSETVEVIDNVRVPLSSVAGFKQKVEFQFLCCLVSSVSSAKLKD